jgi:hypothetical protein
MCGLSSSAAPGLRRDASLIFSVHQLAGPADRIDVWFKSLAFLAAFYRPAAVSKETAARLPAWE